MLLNAKVISRKKKHWCFLSSSHWNSCSDEEKYHGEEETFTRIKDGHVWWRVKDCKRVAAFLLWVWCDIRTLEYLLRWYPTHIQWLGKSKVTLPNDLNVQIENGWIQRGGRDTATFWFEDYSQQISRGIWLLILCTQPPKTRLLIPKKWKRGCHACW